MMNYFQPSVKLQRKKRVGSRLTRQYDVPQTPVDRLPASPNGETGRVATLKRQRAGNDPFQLAATIERKIEQIWDLANSKQDPHIKKKHG
jgi:hypothetical protein